MKVWIFLLILDIYGNFQHVQADGPVTFWYTPKGIGQGMQEQAGAGKLLIFNGILKTNNDYKKEIFVQYKEFEALQPRGTKILTNDYLKQFISRNDMGYKGSEGDREIYKIECRNIVVRRVGWHQKSYVVIKFLNETINTSQEILKKLNEIVIGSSDLVEFAPSVRTLSKMSDIHKVVLLIGLHKTFSTFATNEDLVENDFGRHGAWDNLRHFMLQLASDDRVVCIANTNKLNEANAGFNFLFEEYKKITDYEPLEISKPMRMIQIEDYPMPSTHDQSIPWVYVNLTDIKTNTKYWAMANELLQHVQMLIEHIHKPEIDMQEIDMQEIDMQEIDMQEILNIPSDFLNHKQIHTTFLQPSGVYKTIEFLENRKIDQVEVGSLILGEGSQGKVQFGRCRRTGQIVVLKLTKKSVDRGINAELSIYNKFANSLAGVVNCYATGVIEFKRFYYHYMNNPDPGADIANDLSELSIVNIKSYEDVIELEYAQGEVEVVFKSLTVPEHNGQIIMVQMFDAVIQVLRTGTIHCDIKPDNFVMDLINMLAKLIDFGIAKKYNYQERDPRQFVGTFAFASHNQLLLKMHRPGDDLECLAHTFYKMVTGKCPIPDSNQEESAEKLPNATWSLGCAPIVMKYRQEIFENLEKNGLKDILHKFYNAVIAMNDAIREGTGHDPTEDDYARLRSILTNGQDGFIAKLENDWINEEYLREKLQHIIRPEKHIQRLPIGQSKQTDLEIKVKEKLEGYFSVVERTKLVAILIDIDLICTFDAQSNVKIEFDKDRKQSIGLSPDAEEFLAFTCSHFSCFYVSSHGLVDTHLMNQIPIVGHYNNNIFWQVTTESKDILGILDGIMAYKTSVLVQNTNNRFGLLKELEKFEPTKPARLKVVSKGDKKLLSLVDAVYAHIKDIINAKVQ